LLSLLGPSSVTHQQVPRELPLACGYKLTTTSISGRRASPTATLNKKAATDIIVLTLWQLIAGISVWWKCTAETLAQLPKTVPVRLEERSHPRYHQPATAQLATLVTGTATA